VHAPLARRLLLLDEDQPHTLHMAGALMRHGYEVDILTATPYPRRPYERGRLTVMTAPPVEGGQYEDNVDAIVARRRYQHIIAMSDATLWFVWRSNRAWATRAFPRVPADQIELLRNKRRTCEFAAACGAFIPPIRSAGDGDSLAAAARDLGFPMVVKGVGGDAGGVNVSIVHSFDEAEEAIGATRARTKHEPYLQQYVRGPCYLAGGLFAAGRPLRLFGAEVTQHWPEKTGPAASVRSCNDPALLEPLCAVMKAVNWTGFAQADFIRDEQGRFAFLEINPRPWGSIGAAAQVGVDFFTPLVQLLDGTPAEADLGFAGGREIALFPQRVRAQLRSRRSFVRRWTAAVFDVQCWRAAWATDPRLLRPYLRWMIYRRRDLSRRPDAAAR
jgi:hypothetical protein